MQRRTFLRSVIVGTLAAPFVTRGVKARPYRLSDEHTAAIYDTDWGGSYRVSLWDGDRFIQVVNPQHVGRAVVVPTWTRDGRIVDTVFAHTGRDTSGLADISSQYESGPKWWKHTR